MYYNAISFSVTAMHLPKATNDFRVKSVSRYLTARGMPFALVGQEFLLQRSDYADRLVNWIACAYDLQFVTVWDSLGNRFSVYRDGTRKAA